MANVGDFWAVVGAIATDGGTLIAAVAASLAAIFTYRIMRSAQEQVKVSQAQNQQTLESERDAQLPVLMPIAQLMAIGFVRNETTGLETPWNKPGYDPNQSKVPVKIKNVGPGIALNIWGIVFGPEPTDETQRVMEQHHSHRYGLPLEPVTAESSSTSPTAPRNTVETVWSAGGVAVWGNAEITDGTKHYTLYAPRKPSLADTMRGNAEKVARLTLTYSDIFGRKHAAIYDLTAQMVWENVAYVRNIQHDLDEMQQETLRQLSPLASPLPPTAK